nr:hypothetical protein Hi04_10k_c2651_00039 [uncultured bacterium]
MTKLSRIFSQSQFTLNELGVPGALLSRRSESLCD